MNGTLIQARGLRMACVMLALVGAAGTARSQPAASLTLPQLLASTHVHGLAVDRRDPARLFIATHHGLYAFTAPGPARLVSNHQNDLMGFTPHPTDPLLFFASGHPAAGGNLGFIASTDGGIAWKQLSPGVSGPVDFHQMDISKADPKVIYGNFGGIQVSRDGGLNWKRVGEPVRGIIDLAASAKDANTLYLGTKDGLLVSRDGGKTVQPALKEAKAVTLVEVTRDGTVYAFVYEAGLLRAKEPELNWERLNNQFGESVLLHLAADPADGARLFAVTQAPELLASTDSGRTWRTLAKP